MASFAKIIIVGNVGREPESRQLPSGGTAASFSIAVNERARGNNPEETTWYRVTFYDRAADTIMKFVKKGSLLYVEGKLSLRKYTNRDGVEVTSPEITGSDFQFVGGSQRDSDQGGGDVYNNQGSNQPRDDYNNRPIQQRPSTPAGPPSNDFAGGNDDDDLPF